MAYDLGTITTLVQQRIRDTNYSTSEITQYINDTQNDICGEYRLNFMEAYQDYTTVANVADITNGAGLPTNFLVAIDLVNITSGAYSGIPYKDIQTLDLLNNSPEGSLTLGSGYPLAWYMYARSAYFYPTQSSAYTVRFRYYKSPTLLSGSSDVPLIPQMFQEILVLGAAYRVMQVKDNYDQAGILQNKYDELLAKLVNQTAVNQVGTSPRQRINRYSLAKRNF